MKSGFSVVLAHNAERVFPPMLSVSLKDERVWRIYAHFGSKIRLRERQKSLEMMMSINSNRP